MDHNLGIIIFELVSKKAKDLKTINLSEWQHPVNLVGMLP